MKLLKPITNQRLRLLAVALVLGTLLLDLGVIQMGYLFPESMRPSDSNFMANPGANGAVLVHLAEQEGKPCDIIFIGASNVEYWNTEGREVWDHYYAPRNAFNFGVGGDKTQNLLWRFDHTDLRGLKPKAAVIFIGLNNFNDSPHDTVTGIVAVMKKTQSIFPGIKIILVSLTPNGRDDTSAWKANKLLRPYADDKTIFYVDLYSQMPRQGDNWKGLKPDHLHFTKEGYEIWAEQMEPILQKALLPDPVISKG